MKNDKFATAFGILLRELRHERSLSQEDLGFQSELDRAHISMLELGKRSPSLKTTIALSRGLQMPFVHLAALIEEKIEEFFDK